MNSRVMSIAVGGMMTLAGVFGPTACHALSRQPALLKTPLQMNQGIQRYLESKGIRNVILPLLRPLPRHFYYGATVITDSHLPGSFVVQLTAVPRPHPLNSSIVDESLLPLADMMGSFAVKPAGQPDTQIAFGGGLIVDPQGIPSPGILARLPFSTQEMRRAIRHKVELARGWTGVVYTGPDIMPVMEFTYGRWTVLASQFLSVQAGQDIGRSLLGELLNQRKLPGSGTMWVMMAGDGDPAQLSWTKDGMTYDLATRGWGAPELALSWLSRWMEAERAAGQ